MFGLMDANGWGWAGVKAAFWFLTIIFLLGYIPNVAYYFTVSNTVDVGYNFLSVVNWCPEGNKDLPCPAPAGAVVPWEPSPAELSLPSARSGALAVQSGIHLYIVGGVDASGAVLADTLETTTTSDGNFQPWAQGPALPEPRTDAAYASLSGVPYVIGGINAAGERTTTVYIGILDAGKLTGWALADGQNGHPDLTLPAPVSGGAAVAGPTGLWLLGGRTADGVTNGVWRSTYAEGTTTLGAWTAEDALALPAPRADAAVALVGNTLLVVGGTDGSTATNSVFKLTLEAGEPVIDEVSEEPVGWIVAEGGQMLPDARARAASFNANGVLYVVGGVDAAGVPQFSTLWGISDIDGNVSWHHLDQSNLLDPRVDASAAIVGATAMLIGGEDADGMIDGAVRGNLSPAPPYYRLGLVGATLPALSIKGEVGQQLGYINAMTVGMINFIVLIVIGVAFSHPKGTRRAIARLSRGRITVPAEDEFTA
jgi:hypothetical protein